MLSYTKWYNFLSARKGRRYMLKEKNSAGGGKFSFFNFLKEKENNQAEPINVKEFISDL